MSADARQNRQQALVSDVGERDFLAACLNSELCFWDLSDKITSDQFGVPRNGRIWRAMLQIAGEGKTPTKKMVPLYIQGDDVAMIAAADYLAVICNDPPAPGTVADILDTLLALATRRSIVDAAEKMKALALGAEMGTAASDILDKSVSMIAQVGGRFSDDDRAKPIGEWGRALFRRISDGMRDVDSNPHGFSSGLRAFDEVAGLLQPEKVYVIAALPSVGKSALVRQIVTAAMRQEVERAKQERRLPRWAHCTSLEMTGQENAIRELAELTGFAGSAIEAGELNQAQAEIIGNYVESTLMKLPIIIDEKPRQGIDDIRTRMLQTKRRRGLCLGVVDHLLLVRAAGKREDLNERVTNAVIESKSIAKEFQIPMIVLAQLKNSVFERPRGRPTNADLYGGSSIEQNADVIVFVHRDEIVLQSQEPDIKYAEKHTEWAIKMDKAKGRAELYNGKRRGGSRGDKRELTFRGEIMTFYDL